MATGIGEQSAEFDKLDRNIIHAVHVEPRAPFAAIAEVTGVSEQTVARRYRRLVDDGVLRVLGVRAWRSTDFEQWFLRIECRRPDAALPLAHAIARRDDVSWVTVSGGGSEVVCSTRTRTGPAGQDLLLHRLPRVAEVARLSAHAVLHHFSPEREWDGYGDLLDARQVTRLTTAAGPAPAEGRGTAGHLDADDQPLLDALMRDGRMSLRRLGELTGWSPTRVGRRIETLRASGAIYFDVDLQVARLGFGATSYVWLTVAPRDLDAVGHALVDHTEVAYCAAVSGSSNILLSVVCKDSAHLYRYVTTRIGALAAVRQAEVSPALRRIKQAGSILTDTGIQPTPPPPRPPRRRPSTGGTVS